MLKRMPISKNLAKVVLIHPFVILSPQPPISNKQQKQKRAKNLSMHRVFVVPHSWFVARSFGLQISVAKDWRDNWRSPQDDNIKAHLVMMRHRANRVGGLPARSAGAIHQVRGLRSSQGWLLHQSFLTELSAKSELFSFFMGSLYIHKVIAQFFDPSQWQWMAAKQDRILVSLTRWRDDK